MRVGLTIAALAGAVSATKVTAVQKVIQLLEDMHKQGLAEKQDEEVKFSAYAQFCEDTANHKTAAIQKASDEIEKLAADIAKAAQDAASATAEINELSDDVARWKSDAKAASEIRQKEAIDFQATNQDYSETLDALDRAVATLKKQSFDRTQAESLLQLTKSSSLLSTHVALRSFLKQDPSETYSAPEANAYEFQSGGVVEMMESLQDKFKEERSSLQKEELSTKHEFEQMGQTMADNVENASAVIERRTEYRGARLAAKAEAEGDKADTEASKAADSKYLADLKALCTVKQNAFDERQKLRGEELDAIAQAVDILGSGDVSGAANEHLPTMFLQLNSESQNKNKNVQNVAELLSDRAEKYGSNLLSMLATRVQANPFGKVKKMIRDMIIKLKEEATAETEHKGWCDAELGANKITRKAKEDSIDELNAEVEELSAKIAQLTQEVADLTEAIAQLDKERSEATEKRTAENKANTKAIADAKEAQVAVANALTILEDFYAKAGEASSFYQTKALAMHKAAGPGEDAPETFSEPYQGMGGENGGVIGILEVIQSDFARLESETSASEEANAQEYTTFMNDTEVDKAVKQTDVEHKSNMITKKKGALNEANKELKTTHEELDAANDYYDKLKPSCVDSGITYEERVKRREEEIQSLKEALEVLTGRDDV